MTAALIVSLLMLAMCIALLVIEVRHSAIQTAALAQAGNQIEDGRHWDALVTIDNALKD